MSRRDDYIPVAESIPFDNDTNGFDSDDVQGAVEEIGASASPGFSFGRAANSSSGTWLLRAGGVVSNRAGVTVFINNPEITTVACSTENANTYDVSIYEHEGDQVNLTLLTTVSVVASRSATFDVSVSVTEGRQIAVKLTSGSAKNIGVDLQLKGSN